MYSNMVPANANVFLKHDTVKFRIYSDLVIFNLNKWENEKY